MSLVSPGFRDASAITEQNLRHSRWHQRLAYEQCRQFHRLRDQPAHGREVAAYRRSASELLERLGAQRRRHPVQIESQTGCSTSFRA